MKSKRKLVLIIVLLLSLVVLAKPVSASNDNIKFNFTIKTYHANSVSGEKYRQTTNTKNNWKVNFSYSGEGAGTVTTFWLDKKMPWYAELNHQVVSGTYNVKQGTTIYKPAYSSASQQNVRLGAENNNYSARSYTASGYWDEETD
ncbi:DUF2712 domain-containing protein [Listeria grandensis]|uniref:DUF2712 domain-containing protein n=1 Tax=Listeria grandensis TaxID=1494963 RepID=A0A7X1CPX2_9LIST|nr:DUF2712 domain-containing protein [Listeria grandensis]MBC1936427.1 DUF2712 domain-containing protein [Listeria grandensis]